MIPGEHFAKEDGAHETLETRKKWVTSAPDEIDIEEATSHPFSFGEEEADDS